uniref:Secreted protein n=1 Tax=Strongyloides papillosus TaxID=174720 RepID=A0A0N5CIY1_STREA
LRWALVNQLLGGLGWGRSACRRSVDRPPVGEPVGDRSLRAMTVAGWHTRGVGFQVPALYGLTHSFALFCFKLSYFIMIIKIV